MPQDTHAEAKELYSDARAAMRNNHDRMREDLEFSNPADPQQWPAEMRAGRGVRPTLTLDQTNQYINQVVNDGRQNTPSIQCLPADGRADPIVAEKINGMWRHIEYTSRAGIAYDTALEHAARIGLGWLRILPKVMDVRTGVQEIVIQRVADPLSVVIDPNSTEPDGSDAMYGFAETWWTERALKARWPKAHVMNFGEGAGWFTIKGVRIAEMMKVEETPDGERMVVIDMEGQQEIITEEEARLFPEITGHAPKVIREFQSTKRVVKWVKMTGAEVLEETVFPSQWIGFIPVVGHELFIDGERFLCGMARRMRDGQMFHNWQMSSLAESNLMQPKAPFMAPARAIKGHEKHWAEFNKGNPAFLPYNDIDAEGNPIQMPQRMGATPFAAAQAQGARLGSEEMQASVGMYKSNLGMASSSVSGRAKLADKQEGDTANFHYIDNQRRSLEHLGRIGIDMMPAVYDTARRVRILGIDREKLSFVNLDPKQPEAVRRGKDGKLVAINLNVGTYDVRVKVGPGYTSQRQELADRIVMISQGNPQVAAVLAPLLVKMSDVPDADQVERVLLATLPPEVQAAYQQIDDDDPLSAQVRGVVERLTAQLQQAGQITQQQNQALQQAAAALEDKSQKEQAELQLKAGELAVKQQQAQTDAFNAETERMKVTAEAQAKQADRQLREAEFVEGQVAGQVTSEQNEGMGAQALEAMAGLFELQQAQAEALSQSQQMLAAVVQQQQQQAEAMAALFEKISAPRSVQVVRGPDGRVAGAVATTTPTPESTQ